MQTCLGFLVNDWCLELPVSFLGDILKSVLKIKFVSFQVSEEEVHSLLEDRIITYNNLAQAQLKIKAFDSALQSVENVLRCEPQNVKALFRKGRVSINKHYCPWSTLIIIGKLGWHNISYTINSSSRGLVYNYRVWGVNVFWG